MDAFDRQALGRLPLAEAVLRIWQSIASVGALQAIFDKYRGACYDKVLTFPVLVYLISDALVRFAGSGRQSFEDAIKEGILETSIQAAFGKLRRLPIAVSMGFLVECTVRLVELFPEIEAVTLAKSLQNMEVIIYDGKAIKRVAKRLKPLRNTQGGLLGGRTLVAVRLRYGVAVAMHAHPDGHANDVRFVPDLLPVVRGVVPGVRLHVGDRQFCNVEHLPLYVEGGDHFLLRYSKVVSFTRDPDREVQRGVDGRGRSYLEEWGWLGRANHPKRRYVRRISLERSGDESIAVVTDLLDGQEHPASDLLDVYAQRWQIEHVFQDVTEVFGLKALIGGSPAATIFQFAFCLVLYNIIQLIRAYAAQAGERPVAETSSEKLFGDIQRNLIAWNEVIGPQITIAGLEPMPLKKLRKRLEQLLKQSWTKSWLKAKSYPRRPKKHTGSKRCHNSAHRLLEEHRSSKSSSGSQR